MFKWDVAIQLNKDRSFPLQMINFDNLKNELTYLTHYQGEEDDEDVELPQRKVTSKGDDGTEEEVDDFDINTGKAENCKHD